MLIVVLTFYLVSMTHIYMLKQNCHFVMANYTYVYLASPY